MQDTFICSNNSTSTDVFTLNNRIDMSCGTVRYIRHDSTEENGLHGKILVSRGKGRVTQENTVPAACNICAIAGGRLDTSRLARRKREAGRVESGLS